MALRISRVDFGGDWVRVRVEELGQLMAENLQLWRARNCRLLESWLDHEWRWEGVNSSDGYSQLSRPFLPSGKADNHALSLVDTNTMGETAYGAAGMFDCVNSIESGSGPAPTPA